MPCGYVYSTGMQHASVVYCHIYHIQREASALLVLLIRAMRRPQRAERAAGYRLSRFLFYQSFIRIQREPDAT